jgi:hypothetical protein
MGECKKQNRKGIVCLELKNKKIGMSAKGGNNAQERESGE